MLLYGWLIVYPAMGQFVVCEHPGNFVTKVNQIESQSDLISMSSFADPSYLTSFNLRSLYLQSLQCLPNLILLQTLETAPICTSFQ